MSNKSYQKTLVIVIILLFVVIGVKPSIGENNGEISC